VNFASIALDSAAADWLAHALSNDQLHSFLLSLGDMTTRYFKGFSVSSKNADKPAVRNRVKANLQHHAPFRSMYLNWPNAPWTKWQQILELLDQHWLLLHWRELARDLGGPSFLVALACSDNERYSAIGRRLLARRGPWQLQARCALPGTPLSAQLQALQQLAELVPAHGNSYASEAAGKPEATLGQLRSLENENQHLRQRIAKQETHANDDAAKHQDASQAAARAIEQLRQEITRIEAERQHLAATVEDQLAERMQQFRRDVLGITPEIEYTRQQWCAKDGKIILAEVENILDRQCQLNEKHRTLAQVRSEIDELERAQQRLQQASSESVVVAPELAQVLHDVQARLKHLRNLPAIIETTGIGTTATLERRLHEHISSVASGRHGLDQLQEIEQSLRQEPLRGCLDMAVRRQLLAQVQQRRQLLQRQQKEKTLATIMPPQEEADAPPSIAYPEPLWDVQYQLNKISPPVSVAIVVDAYNVIKNVSELLDVESRFGLAAARQRLLELCQRQRRKIGRCELVYDGATAMSTHELLGGIHVVYAAKKCDSQNADRHIIEQAPLLAEKYPHLWLVSLDGELRYRCRSACTAFIAPNDFYSFLLN